MFLDENAAHVWFEEMVWPEGDRFGQVGGSTDPFRVQAYEDELPVLGLRQMPQREDQHSDGRLAGPALEVGLRHVS